MGLCIQKNEGKQDLRMSWTSSLGTVLETNRHEDENLQIVRRLGLDETSGACRSSKVQGQRRRRRAGDERGRARDRRDGEKHVLCLWLLLLWET